ncbi:lytic transglycosylase [Megaira polyxenophila phage MAnkyphage_25.80]|nr:lytic transglycosylase [Megaira polyxenophila phage MAnkyphage_25.80]
MFILNRYDVTTPATAAAVGAVNNVNPDVITGATGNSAGTDSVTPIVANAIYTDQVISKLVAISVPAGGLTAAVNNYLTVDLVKLGITGVRPVFAALLLGVYNPASTEQVGAGATPSFIGIWDKTVANVNSLSVVNSRLILRIPTAQIALFSGKTAMVQLFFSTDAGE